MTLCHLAYVWNLKFIRAERMVFAGVMRVVVRGEILAKGCRMRLARSTDSMWDEREVCVT